MKGKFTSCDFSLDPGKKESDLEGPQALSLGRERNRGATPGDGGIGRLKGFSVSRGQFSFGHAEG